MTAPADVRTCYRHPDRVAGITCQRCDRPICPACMHQASVGFHCPECTRSGAQKEYRGLAALRGRPVVTQVLIGINVAVFVAGLVASAGRGATGRGSGWLVEHGALWAPLVPEEPWRLITSGFLHAGLIHVGLNMWVLWVLGQMLEPILGRARFAAVYAASLCAGSFGVVVMDAVQDVPHLTVGASGAIYGLMGVAIVVARERRINLMRSGLVTILALNLLLTFTIPGISVGGHLGGLVGGFVAGAIVVYLPSRLGARGGAVATALSGVVALGFLGAAYAVADATWGHLPF